MPRKDARRQAGAAGHSANAARGRLAIPDAEKELALADEAARRARTAGHDQAYDRLALPGRRWALVQAMPDGSVVVSTGEGGFVIPA